MAKEKSVDEMTDDAVREGGYLAMIYFDLHASAPEAVQNLMVGFIGKLTREPGVIYAVGEIDKPMEKEGMFSTWAEVKLLARDFATLVRISSQYSPIGIEILRPDEVKMTLGEAQSSLLDVSQTSQNFTRLIMEKMLSEGEKKDYARKMEQRMELGKKLFEKKR
ncbi:MAG: hypothetical protein WC717_05160 [Candidatus Micrarchaeia archaeon]|jgi:hypothetical protein